MGLNTPVRASASSVTPTGNSVGTTRLRACPDRVRKSQHQPRVEITVALLMNWIIAELPLELSLCRRLRSWSPTSLLGDTEPLHMRAGARGGMLAAEEKGPLPGKVVTTCRTNDADLLAWPEHRQRDQHRGRGWDQPVGASAAIVAGLLPAVRLSVADPGNRAGQAHASQRQVCPRSGRRGSRRQCARGGLLRHWGCSMTRLDPEARRNLRENGATALRESLEACNEALMFGLGSRDRPRPSSTRPMPRWTHP